MLKLEKSKKNGEIQIQLRPSMRLFDRYFLLALAAAVALHLFAALLFHVRLFSMGEIETILPATKAYAHFVKGSANENDAIVSAQVNMEGRFTPAQLHPPQSMPLLKPLNPSHPIYSIDYSGSRQKKNNPFIEIEKDIEENHFALLDIPVVASSVKIAITGPLAKIPLQDIKEELSPLFTLRTFSPKNLHQERAVYTVQVDAKSGQIFWFQPHETTLNKLQTTLAEKLLKNMLFQIHPGEFIQTGQIELTFTSEAA